MKRIIAPILLSLLVPAGVRADTPLTITSGSPFGCLQNAYLYPVPLQVNGSFTLNGVSGSGTIVSTVPASAPTFGYPPNAYFYNYSIDLSHLPTATNHCVKLLIHFGAPNGCAAEQVFGDPTVIHSATLATFGDITFVFNSGCLVPGQPSVSMLMFSEALPRTNVVTVIDDYVDPVSGLTNEARINVTALVPDIPPDPPIWTYYQPINIPYTWFQGSLTWTCNSIAPPFGLYDFSVQLMNAPKNGLVASQQSTQTVQVANGLFNLPLPFDPVNLGNGAARWLNMSVRPSGGNGTFTPVGPPLPLTPTPQAYYAFSAGVVADLTPGQAVTSLDGLTDAVNLQAGNGIILGTNGNTLTIAAPGVVSDRSLKTDFSAIKPEAILARLAQLPISSWRYTNEVAGVRHVGPMAQDFKAAFGLGDDDKLIGFVDEEGVALAAIQGLHQQLQQQTGLLNEKDAEIQKLKQQNETLEKRLDHVEQTLKAMNITY